MQDIPKPQKLAPPKPLSYYQARYPEREAIVRAYLSGHYALAEVGAVFSRRCATVVRAVKAFEGGKGVFG